MLRTEHNPLFSLPEVDVTVKSALIAAALAILACHPACADVIESAQFSGGVLYPNVPHSFLGVNSNNGNFTGTFSVDVTGVPGTGYYNASLSGTPEAALAFSFGSLSLPLASDNSGAPAVQFNNGQFNGLVFNTNFNVSGQEYDLSVQGGSISVYQGPYAFGTLAASGYISIGNSNLSDVTTRIYTPGGSAPKGVPEPAALVMFVSGLLLLGAFRRVRRA